MFYVLLEQYEEDEFGVDDNCGLDPTTECDGFPRWAIPIIIGAAFSLSKRIISMTHSISGKISQQTGKNSQHSGKNSQRTGKNSQLTGKNSQHAFAVR